MIDILKWIKILEHHWKAYYLTNDFLICYNNITSYAKKQLSQQMPCLTIQARILLRDSSQLETWGMRVEGDSDDYKVYSQL